MNTKLRSTRRVLLAAIVTTLLGTLILPMSAEPVLRAGDRLAIIGDSITQARKYSALIETYLLVCQPGGNIDTMTHGWSGEQASGLAKRVANDVVRFAPTVATTSYGMNDGRYAAFNDANAEAFRDATTRYVQQLKQAGTRVIVIGSPGCVDPASFTRVKPASVYNDTLTKFGQIARDVAQKEGVLFADVNAAMLDTMSQLKAHHGEDYVFIGTDGYHPDWAGHFVMAYAFLKAIVADHEVGRITHDFKDGSTQTSPGHAVIAAQPGGIELESTRYPFCFFGEENDQAGTRSVASLTGFNDELNRLTLVVKNAPARCRVTWGTRSAEFTAEELSEGINLAAEFAGDNPFSPAFRDVLNAVQSKQAYEVHMVKSLVTHLPIITQRLVPDDPAAAEQLLSTVVSERQRRADDLRKLVVPVRHHIRIEAVE